VVYILERSSRAFKQQFSTTFSRADIFYVLDYGAPLWVQPCETGTIAQDREDNWGHNWIP
jgi:hypothetical protein